MQLTDLAPGMQVLLDNGFTCIDAGVVELFEEEGSLYFKCSHGKHFIDGQEDGNGGLIGILPAW